MEAAQTGTCSKFRNDAGLEDHIVIVTGFTWGQRTAMDTDSCLSVREDARKDTHIAHCMEILIAEDSETLSESRPGPGKPPPQSFSGFSQNTGNRPGAQSHSQGAKISVLTKRAAGPLKS